jgi:hypothetical protein
VHAHVVAELFERRLDVADEVDVRDAVGQRPRVVQHARAPREVAEHDDGDAEPAHGPGL